MAEDGNRWSRQWSMNAKGAISTEAQTPEGWDPEATMDALLPGRFFAMDDQERAEAIMRGGVEHRDDVQEYLERMEGILGTQAGLLDLPQPDAVKAAIAGLIERRKELKRDAKRLQETLKTLGDTPPDLAKPDPEALRKANQDVETSIKAATEARMAAEKAESVRAKALAENLLEAPEWTPENQRLLEAATAMVQANQATEKERAEIERSRKSLLDRCDWQPEEIDAAKDLLAQPEPPEASPDAVHPDDLRQEEQTEANVTGQLKGAVQEYEKVLREESETATHKSCPCCGTSGEHFQEAVASLYAFKKAVAQERIETLKDRMKNAQIRVNDMRERLKANEAATEARTAWEAARALVGREQALDRELDALTAREAALRPIDKSAETAKATLEARKRLADLRAMLGDIPTEAQVQELRLKTVNAQADLEAKKDIRTKAQREAVAYAAAARTVQQREKYLQDIAATTKALEATQADIDAGEGLMIAMGDQAGQALRESFDHFSDALRAGETLTIREDLTIGMTKTTGFIPWKVLSGSERAILSYAVAVALASRSPARIALLDETGIMDPARKALFYQTVAEALEKGMIDQAILVDHSPPPGHKGTQIEIW
jgi:hypothetical protein